MVSPEYTRSERSFVDAIDIGPGQMFQTMALLNHVDSYRAMVDSINRTRPEHAGRLRFTGIVARPHPKITDDRRDLPLGEKNAYWRALDISSAGAMPILDPVHRDIYAEGENIMIGTDAIPLILADAGKSSDDSIPWPGNDENTLLVIDTASGVVKSTADAARLLARLERPHEDMGVILFCTHNVKSTEGVDLPLSTLVIGVNEDEYKPEDPSRDEVITNKSCTGKATLTTMLALERAIGVPSFVFLSTVHGWTPSNVLSDSIDVKSPRKKRAAANAILPVTSGAIESITERYPGVDTFDTVPSYRVQVPRVSLLELVALYPKGTNPTVEQVGDSLISYANEVPDVYGVVDRPNTVSTDIDFRFQSGVADLPLIMVKQSDMGTAVYIPVWYTHLAASAEAGRAAAAYAVGKKYNR